MTPQSCTGNSKDQIQASAEWPPASYDCGKQLITSDLNYAGAHNLQLGPYCGSPLLGGKFNFEDYVECAVGNDYNIDISGDWAFQCSSQQSYKLQSQDLTVSIEETTRIFIDDFDEECYTFEGQQTDPPTDPPVPPPTSPPVDPPTPPPSSPSNGGTPTDPPVATEPPNVEHPQTPPPTTTNTNGDNGATPPPDEVPPPTPPPSLYVTALLLIDCQRSPDLFLTIVLYVFCKMQS